MLRVFFSLLFVLSLKPAQSPAAPYPHSALPSSDNDYYIYKTKQYWLLFSGEYQGRIDTFNEKIRAYIDQAQFQQKITFKDPLIVILVSSRTQLSNAMASLFPFLQVQIYGAGLGGGDLMAHSHWLDMAFVHELTHAFQINHSLLPSPLKKILKSPKGLLFGFLLFTHPNFNLPSALLEGDAVLKESLIENQGGRLFSGFIRALVYSHISYYRYNQDDFIRKRLINKTPTPLSELEKYAHGAYLMSALAEEYSSDAITQFFKKNAASHFLLPWSYSASLDSVFGMDIDDVTYFYFNRYINEAYLQRSSSKRILFESALCHPFTEQGGHVFFLTSDKKSKPNLRIYNRKEKTWSSQEMDLPLGKVFQIGEAYYSRASAPTGVNILEYSLFSEEKKPLKNFNSKYVEALQGDHILFIDPKNTLDGLRLFYNHDFYETINSNALFDSEGSIYYFKQEGVNRTLYKNKNPIFSYPGFYGRLAHVNTDDRSFYFTGASPYGSSLYRYENAQITRVSASDTIIRAHFVGDKEWLVCEIAPHGFEYKIIPEEELREAPVLYQYQHKNSFTPPLSPKREEEEDEKIPPSKKEKDLFIPFSAPEGDDLNQLFENETNPKDPLDEDLERSLDTVISHAPEPVSFLKYKKYKPLRHLRFSSSGFELNTNLISLNDFYGGWSLLFSDLLQHQFLKFSYRNQSLISNQLGFQIGNRSKRLNTTIGYRYTWKQNVFKNLFKTDWFYSFVKELPESSHGAFVNFYYPLLQKGRWSAGSLLSTSYVDELLSRSHSFLSFFKKKIEGSQYHHQAFVISKGFRLSYSKAYPLTYLPNRLFHWMSFLQYSKDLGGLLDELKLSSTMKMNFHLGHEFYLTPVLYYSSILSGGAAPVQTRLHNLWTLETSNEEDKTTPFYFKSRWGRTHPYKKHLKLFSKGASSASFRLRKVLNTPLYFKVIPFSLVRLIPLVQYQYLILEYPRVFKKNTFDSADGLRDWVEWSAGMEAQGLVYYKTPVSLGIIFGVSWQAEWIGKFGQKFAHFYVKAPL